MNFTSTRNKDLSVKFSQAVRDCIPEDGGVFIPEQRIDLRKWIYYIDETTSFDSIAGTLTSAFIEDEFSPIICEKIATSAFSFTPEVKQLDSNLFLMELFHGSTGNYRDFGISYLCSYLETTFELKGGNAVFVDYTHGALGAMLSNALKGKKHIKAVLVYREGEVQGLSEEDYVWNGGNIYPVEMKGSDSEIRSEITKIFADREFVHTHNLTVANTTNVCRFLSQMFFFPYSFSRIKNKVDGDIVYAMDSGNYGTLMAGLYSWNFALPVNGFYLPTTNSLDVNLDGNPVILDSFVNIKDRKNASPMQPSNIERLESFFATNALMMRNFVFPTKISDADCEAAAKELFVKYNIYADKELAKAYGVVKENYGKRIDEESAVVLVAYNHPSLSAEFCNHVLGEAPEMPENIKRSLKKVNTGRNVVSSADEIRNIIKTL